MSKEAKVGIFVLLGLLILTYFTFRISKLGGVAGKGYTVVVDFDTAAGLEPKADVKMAGVPVGKVEEIQLVGTRARLLLRIRDDVRIPKDSTAAIQAQGLLGEKYVEIYPGKATDQNLPPGGRIVNVMPAPNLDEIIRKVNGIADDVKRFTDSLAANFGTPEGKQAIREILQNVRETTASLRNVVTGNEERLNRILVNVDRLSADLRTITADNKENLRQTIANLREFSQTLKEETPELAKKLEDAAERMSAMADKAGRMADNASVMLAENRENVRESVSNFRSASARLDNTLDSAGKVVGRIERGEGTLGKLISDNSVAGSLSDTLEGINKFVRKADSLKTFIDYKLEYRTESSDFKHYVNLRLQPAADKYYLVGVVDDPIGNYTTTDVTLTSTPGGTVHTVEDKYTNKLLFSAQIAKRFSGLTFRGGVIESTGGVGADWQPYERVGFSADAFDFARKNDRPHLKLSTSYGIVKNLFVTAGADDLLSKQRKLRTLFLGFGINFADEDLKTILGAVPIKP